MLTTRTLGSQGLTVSALGLGLMGMSQAYGTAEERDERESIATIHRAIELGVHVLRHGRGVRAVTRTRSCWLARSRSSAGRSASASSSRPSSASRSRTATSREWTAGPSTSARPSRARSAGSTPTTSTCSTSIASIPRCRSRTSSARWPSSCARGRCASSVSPRRASRRFAARTPCIRSRRCRASTRCGSATSSPRSSRCCASCGIGLVPFAPLGRGFLTGDVKRAEEYPEDDFRRGDPRYQGENFDANMQAASAVRELAAQKGRDGGADRARVAAAQGRRHRADPGHQAAEVSRGERRGGRHPAHAATEMATLDAALAPEKVAGPRYNESRMSTVDR